MAGDNQAPAWEVTGQMPGSGLAPNGAFTKGMTVQFRTRDGATGELFVPEAQYTADTVRDMINAKVATIAAVSALRG